MTKRCNLAMIVEGQTERNYFNKFVPKSNISIAKSFSGHTSLEAISKHVASLMRLFPSQCEYCIVLMDREMRQQASVELEASIYTLISRDEHGIGCIRKYCVICPDTMIENWMLADIESIKNKKYIRASAKQRRYDGYHGVKEIKKIFVKGVTYDKITHGVEMLSLINEKVAKTNSPSFARFVNSLRKK